MSQKSTYIEAFEEIHRFVLVVIHGNMAVLVQSDKYSIIKTSDTTTNEYYAIKFVSGA